MMSQLWDLLSICVRKVLKKYDLVLPSTPSTVPKGSQATACWDYFWRMSANGRVLGFCGFYWTRILVALSCLQEALGKPSPPRNQRCMSSSHFSEGLKRDLALEPLAHHAIHVRPWRSCLAPGRFTVAALVSCICYREDSPSASEVPFTARKPNKVLGLTVCIIQPLSLSLPPVTQVRG